MFFFPISFENCLIASKKGKLSISPTVPPISQITKSSLVISPLINSLILSVHEVSLEQFSLNIFLFSLF